MQYYVDRKAKEGGNGDREHPFTRIQQAADIALPGDEVLVMPGIYRENVNPKHAGTESARISYRSVEPLAAEIRGSERIQSWTPVPEQKDVWTARVKNSLFSERNPFTTLVSGDWFMGGFVAHTGDVFLNEKSMYEVTSLDGVLKPQEAPASWDKAFSTYTWYTEQDERKDETVLYANFHGLDPNEEAVEISARSSCFYPLEEGIGFITLSGFRVLQAATQWAPPTAYQEGMVGPHWSRGWIIEDCEIAESKCSGISLGKYYQAENDNKWSKWKYKDGTQTERDCILQAQREGWTKERIGHHIVRRCNIHDCGQTGIVGHLGGVFSVIEDNHIHHINNKQNLAGAEIGGIKMHAAIDVIFRHNHIHHCTRGLWLDWQAQGTRVTGNLFHDNTLPYLDKAARPGDPAFEGLGEDIFVEVSHGPTLIDNNILLSPRAVKMAAQGIALIHNLIAGSLVSVSCGCENGALSMPSPRYTPYHVPHRTEVAGFMTFLHGDHKVYNNIFVQQTPNPALVRLAADIRSTEAIWDDGSLLCGTSAFNGYETLEEWKKDFEGFCGLGAQASDRYYKKLPVWSAGNIYFNGALAWKKEEDACEDFSHAIQLQLTEEEGKTILTTNLSPYLAQQKDALLSTEDLGIAFEPEEKYENPDGSPIVFDCDFFGNKRSSARKDSCVLPGPFSSLEKDRLELFQKV